MGVNIQRFAKGEDFARLGLGDEPPAKGWAVRPDGAYLDGVKVGTNARYQRADVGGRLGSYAEIIYDELG